MAIRFCGGKDVGLSAVALLLMLGARAWGQQYSASILYPVVAPEGTTNEPREVTSFGSVGSETWGDGTEHAVLWSAGGTATELDPTDLGSVDGSQIMGEFGNQQVGSFGEMGYSYFQAVLWTGTPGSAVDLNPSQLGMFSSRAMGTDGSQQVGAGLVGSISDHISHAVMWNGSAGSAVDLNPTDLGSDVGSLGFGIYGNQEVGEYGSATMPLHAVLWSGSASSAIDLAPLDMQQAFSVALATNGNEQVGEVRPTGGSEQAYLWYGTAASATDLNPTGLVGVDSSAAVATNGQQQVGWGYESSASGNDAQALVWSGTADSVVDLQSMLPSNGTWNFSDARSIDEAGDVFGVVNGTYGGASGYFPVEWTPVPEPSAIVLCACGVGLCLRRRTSFAERK
jgi:hypothetical protein